MHMEDSVTIGRRLRRTRRARGKSLRVVAGLAGISGSYLCRLELGERALDRLSLIDALAGALQIAPSELTKLPVSTLTDDDTDAAVSAVRLALVAVDHDRPGGQVLPVEALRARVKTTVDAHCRQGRDTEVGAALPALIADLHTSTAAGRDVAALLDLTVLLHTTVTTGWLRVVGAPLDLRSQAVFLGRRAAQDRDTPTAMGLATWGGLHVMLSAGAVELAQAELDSVTVPTTTPESTQLAGMLALSRSLVAMVDKRSGDVDPSFEFAGELAERTGEANAYWMGFGPTNVGFWRMYVALEAGDHERAASVAEGLRPQVHPHRGSQALYWVDYGRALSRLRGRRDDAALALRRAEVISPNYLHRDPHARDTLGELLVRARQDAVGRELRGMASRAGLPV